VLRSGSWKVLVPLAVSAGAVAIVALAATGVLRGDEEREASLPTATRVGVEQAPPSPNPAASGVGPVLPRSEDVIVADDGRFEATSADGCVWSEYTRVTDPRDGRTMAVLQSNCRRDIIAHYHPDTGEIEGAIQ
jgi:hypothetical protein